jgi:hypothetical protein
MVYFLFVAGVINIYLAKGTCLGRGCLPAEASAQAGAPLLQILSIRYPHPQASFRLKKSVNLYSF